MSDKAFNTYYQTMTQVAVDVIGSEELQKDFAGSGVKLKDWQDLTKHGQAAESFDLAQTKATQTLEPAQNALEAALEIINQGISSITNSKKAILRDLEEEPTATEDDKIFVRDLSFASLAPTRKKESEEERRNYQSKAQEAIKLQVTRMVDGINAEERKTVAKAFTGRDLDAATLATFKKAATDLSGLQSARDTLYLRWLEAGQREREEIAEVCKIWDSIRQNVTKVGKTKKAVALLLERLKKANEQAKTGPSKKAAETKTKAEAKK